MDLDARLAHYAALVRASPHNLMSARGLEELEDRHLPECLALARMLPPGQLVDIGSGAGLPGMVIALARGDIAVTLVEATLKKASFLEDAAADLDLPVEIRNERAEDTVRSRPGTYDVVTARAVAPLRRLVPWAVPLLRPGGLFYAVKGRRWHQELDDARPVLDRHGAVVATTPPDRRAYDPTVDPPLRAVIITAGDPGPSGPPSHPS